MELRQLKYFVGIVEMGSLSRASQSLHIAQPALSQQVSRLEDELGVKLLTRSVRGVTPTAAGLAVYRQAQHILKQVAATPLIATQGDMGPAGPVALGLPWTVTSVLGLDLLKAVTATLSGVRLEVVEGPSSGLAQMLAQGKLDLAVLFDNSTDGGLVMDAVVVEPLLLVGARGALAGHGSGTLADAAALPLLLLSRPNGIREQIEQVWALHGHKPRVLAEINAPGLLIDAVRAGLGFAVLPACAIEDRIRQGDLDAIELEGGTLQRTVYLSTSRLFAPTLAANHVHQLVARLMREAIEQRRWNGQWVGQDPAGSSNTALSP